MRKAKLKTFNARRYILLFAILCVFSLLFVRAVQLQLLHADFYNEEGSNRYIRTVEIPANRGVINDRFGQALAISTPVYSIWARPQTALDNPDSIIHAANALDMDASRLSKKLQKKKEKQFVYLKRHALPDVADQIRESRTPGISLRREYRRYYPAGEMAGHILGLTNIDDQGLEGIELAFDDWLHGEPGKKRVIKDGYGKIVADIELVQESRPGKSLSLSIDKRIQYLAYRELKRTVTRHAARAGSVVVLSVNSGEILAMVNLPAFNPNDRSNAKYSSIRNRAITDVFEPGSTVKPFLIAAALESGEFRPGSKVDTAPGFYKTSGLKVSDYKNYGVVDMQTLLAKSSNVGAVKVALKLDEEVVWKQYQAVGFGSLTGSGFPGEREGKLDSYTVWSKTQRATMAYGYGMSTTALQLARAYSVIANDGILLPVSFVAHHEAVSSQRIMSPQIANTLKNMLRAVVSPEGTGRQAMMQSYSAAGKSGTSKKSEGGEYAEAKYISLFAGMAPADQPEIVVVAVIDEPTRHGYYGGAVAGPLFAKVSEGSLRLMNVPPDKVNFKRNNLLLVEAGEE
ncbi:MAG: penicillin-binding protein 2 [Pseudomonadota bacterium]